MSHASEVVAVTDSAAAGTARSLAQVQPQTLARSLAATVSAPALGDTAAAAGCCPVHDRLPAEDAA